MIGSIVCAVINERASLVLELLFAISDFELRLVRAPFLARAMQLVLGDLGLTLWIRRGGFVGDTWWVGHLFSTAGLATLDLVTHNACEALF